jgi:hypothetical protein
VRRNLHPRTVALRELSGRLPDVRASLGKRCLAGRSLTAVVPCCPGVAHRLRANRGPLRDADDQRRLDTVDQHASVSQPASDRARPSATARARGLRRTATNSRPATWPASLATAARMVIREAAAGWADLPSSQGPSKSRFLQFVPRTRWPESQVVGSSRVTSGAR